MTDKLSQKQSSGDGSTNLQADQITVNQGITYSDARDIALDVFNSNFHKLSEVANDIAVERAKKVTDDFLVKLHNENPDGIYKAQDPDFQYSLFTAQKEYARTGDDELGALLVDLLVDRSKQEQRSILQIVLNESLSVAPKLTKEQLAVLAVCFLFRHTQNHKNGNQILFGTYLDNYVRPFVNDLTSNESSYRHLQFSGCGAVSMGEISLEKILGNTYQGLFLKGFSAEEIETRNISIGNDNRFFIPCLNDTSKIQVRALSKENLEQAMENFNTPTDDRPKLLALFNHSKMNDQEIRGKCIEIRPYMAGVFEFWTESKIKNFDLTSVGIAIGHANIKRLTGEFANLSIWIN